MESKMRRVNFTLKYDNRLFKKGKEKVRQEIRKQNVRRRTFFAILPVGTDSRLGVGLSPEKAIFN